MFKNLRIGTRLIWLIAIQVVVLIAISFTAIVGLNFAATKTAELSSTVSEGTQLDYVKDTVRGELIPLVLRVKSGDVPWEDGIAQLKNIRTNFNTDWKSFTEGINDAEKEFIEDTLGPGLIDLNRAFDELQRQFEEEDSNNLSLFITLGLNELVDPFMNALIASSSERQLIAKRTLGESIQNNNLFLYIAIGVIAAGIIIAGIVGGLIYRSITNPISRVSRTVAQVAAGNYDVRTELKGRDELSELGAAFDEMLEDKVTSLVSTESENKQLNNSVFRLLEAVAQIGERDLTVSVPVTNDITGPVSDAINNMVEETSNVLKNVASIARDVETASNSINEQATTVNAATNAQQQEVELSANDLAAASEALNQIAETARECNRIASLTSNTTQVAADTVADTLGGMNEIRESIQETGKRIKRLGERSNEITSIVDIINTIAERTHVLALNASVQAAAAGEAGRGFAVVADEVQRLAQNAREATAQISSLIKNIQVDTNDTIITMDRTITQVVEGSQLAEEAGKQMAETQQSTGRLVTAVGEIASSSEQQARIGQDLRGRASQVVQRTRDTAQQMLEQLEQTKNLVTFSDNLLSSVSVFKLPN
ncbi:methyl-accepting chemotaxis protein [Pseudomonadota bacterium]